MQNTKTSCLLQEYRQRMATARVVDVPRVWTTASRRLISRASIWTRPLTKVRGRRLPRRPTPTSAHLLSMADSSEATTCVTTAAPPSRHSNQPGGRLHICTLTPAPSTRQDNRASDTSVRCCLCGWISVCV